MPETSTPPALLSTIETLPEEVATTEPAEVAAIVVPVLPEAEVNRFVERLPTLLIEPAAAVRAID